MAEEQRTEERQDPVLAQILTEQNQAAATRRPILAELEKELGRPVVSFFTSFFYPVGIEDEDADMLEGILQRLDLSEGLALIINSPGGSGLAAERIINVCRSYSDTDEYWAIVPNKAKSAATMVCFGASKNLYGDKLRVGAH
jgi:ClpP class serine protease